VFFIVCGLHRVFVVAVGVKNRLFNLDTHAIFQSLNIALIFGSSIAIQCPRCAIEVPGRDGTDGIVVSPAMQEIWKSFYSNRKQCLSLRNNAMTIESSKTLGGIGAILLVLAPLSGWWAGGFSGILGLAGLILVLVGLNGLANVYRERRILNNALYGVFLAIIGMIVAAVIFVYSAFGIISALGIQVSNWTDPAAVQQAFQSFNPMNYNWDWSALMPYIGAAALAFIILFVCLVFSVVLIRRSLNTVADKSGTHMFSTAALLMLIGAILTIVIIGFLLIWVSLILLAVAFFEMRTTQPPSQTAPQPASAQA
jgi:uncharacterized membrane protein